MALLSLDDAPNYTSGASGGNAFAAQSRLPGEVSQIAPLATNYGVQQAPMPIAQNKLSNGNTGVISGAAHFLGSVATGAAHLAGAAEQWLYHNTVSMVEAPAKYGAGLANAYLDNRDLNSVNANSSAVSSRITNLTNQYKSGTISASQYKLGLKVANEELDSLVGENKSISNKIASDYTGARQATIDTSALLLSLGVGFGKAAETLVTREGLVANKGAQSASDWLFGKVATPLMQPAADYIAKSAVNPEVFKALTSTAQQAIARATAEAATAGTTLTAGQITRAAAVNVALKYPILYNWISNGGTQVYNELQKKQYGAAVNTLAFNAAIVTGGGLFGDVLKGAGGAYRSLVTHTFGQTSFTDELSKGLFGDSRVLFDAAVNNPQHIKALSDLEATLMKATNGDAVAAAWRAINGERAVDGLNAIDKGPLGWLEHNTDWANASKAFSAEAKKAGMENVIAGRWTAVQAKMVATQLRGGTDTAGWTKIWGDLKTQFPDSAFANNPNLDAQVMHYITTAKSSDEIYKLVNGIKAGQFAKGFSEDIARTHAAKGFIPVTVSHVAAPFTEGTGKLGSKFANGEEFFTKTVTPLPVLKSVGALFTKIGLSPQASTEVVKNIFNDNLSKNLEKSSVAQKVEKFLDERGLAAASKKAGTTSEKVVKAEDVWAQTGLSAEDIAYSKKFKLSPEEATRKFGGGEGKVVQTPATPAENVTPEPQEAASDYMHKVLSSYAYNPTRTGLLTRQRIMDLRQLTNKDIRSAFADHKIQLTHAEAHEVQVAISDAHLRISTAATGLGDKAFDLLYSTPGVRAFERRFLRAQGVLRFSANPFFQYGRAVPKLEILSEASGGGWLKSVFTGRTQQMDEIQQGLHDAGFLNETGGLGHVTTDEAVFYETGSRNIHKQLLPAQEKSIAGMVDSLAQRSGLSWQDYIKTNETNVKDLIQSIAEYDRKSDFLNSPLARTLNVAFFPFRFEAKVLTIMTKSLARQDLFTKTAFINGIIRSHDFLNSPAGQAWYSANADIIGVFKYLTPVASLNEVMQSLLPGHDHSLGNFGELGGLPFGWIPQILDAEGLTHFNQPGVDAKTGAVIPRYVPATSKGQAAIAIQDLLGSMFSYPGATAGLPSKTGIERKAALGIVQGNKATDLTLSTPPINTLSQQQQVYAKNISSKLNPVTPATPAQPVQKVTVPAQSSQLPRPAIKASGSGSKKLKKSQFTPALLPGQSSLGQL